jgi:hypothetical protein
MIFVNSAVSVSEVLAAKVGQVALPLPEHVPDVHLMNV